MARRYLAHLILLLLAISFIVPPLYADDVLVEEQQPLPLKHFFGDDPILVGTELILSGQNNSDKQQLLVFRMDNASSNNYRSRVNQEYSLPPGEFTLSIPLTGLKTSGGNSLKQPYSEFFVFTTESDSELQLHEARITEPEALPENTLALDFGHRDSPVYPGFQAVLNEDQRLTGTMLTRFRKSGDALIRDGIEGIESVVIPWPNGRWKLSLWAQDQGEWEYLPHYLSRKITVEGNDLVENQWTVEQWVKDVYFAGARKEAELDGDLWQLIGERRSGLIQKNITINDGTLSISFEGERAAKYLAALVLEPREGGFAEQTQDQRKERLLSQWPVETTDYPLPKELSITDISDQIKNDNNYYRAAKGTLLNLVFEVNSPVDDSSPVVAIAPPRSDKGNKLSVETRYGHWRYERPQPNATSLILSDSYLRSDLSSMKLSNQKPRRIHVQVNIPVSAAPGDYEGTIQVFSNNKLLLQDFNITVLPITLPRLEVPIGLYLEPAPYYQWFKKLNKRELFASACDLSLLATQGFTTVAPSLATPDTDAGRSKLINQLNQLKRFGFNTPVLAYAPFKRLLAMHNQQDTELSLLKLREALQGKELPDIFWSIFDEPAPEKFANIAESATILQNPNLNFKTAGHLNNPKQQQLTSTADLLIMNHGYGVTSANIDLLKKSSQVWLYNIPKPRLAAGAYLWRSGAQGYIQWHGRMPTADPFDPTDGREGDVAYIYPWQGGCPDTINIHRRLLDLHEATLDYRWLQWLEAQAKETKKAGILLKEVQKSIPRDWEDAEGITPQQLLEIRSKIMELVP